MEPKDKTLGRLDKLLHQAFPALSNRHIEEAITGGWVRAPHGKTAKGLKVESLEGWDLERLRAHLEQLKKGNPALEIPVVHEAPDFWVVDKPAGLPGHPLGLEEVRTVTHWAFAREPEIAERFPDAQPTLTPHRLDTDTSGALIVARTVEAFDTWRGRFARHEVTKVYRAWCWGTPTETEFTCHKPIGRATGKGTRMETNGADARPALSRVKVLRTEDGRFLAEVVCETGVTHQVRVHLSDAGFPLVGDTKYDFPDERRESQSPHHELHAWSLSWQGQTYEVPNPRFL